MKHPFLLALSVTFAVLMVPAILTGCTTAPEQPPLLTEQDYASLQDRLKALTKVELRGRLNIKTTDGSMGAVFNYSRDTDSTVVKITSSFGKNIATVKIREGEATLVANNHLYSAPTANELFQQVTGLSIPVDKLNDIILGIAQPISLQDEQGKLLSSSIPPEYTVTYQRYTQNGSLIIPAELTIRAPKNSLTIKTHKVVTLE